MPTTAEPPGNTCDFDSFFPLSPGGIDGETDLRRDILLLTSLLKNAQPGSSTATPSKSAEKALSTWSHISYMLSTGDKQSDKYENKVVAVTGHLEPETLVIAAVVSQNTSFEHDLQAKTRSHTIVVEEVQKRTSEQVRALKQEASPDVPSDHLADTAALIAHYYETLKPDMQETSKWSHVFGLIDFIVRRNYLKMSARLESGRATWTDHPLVAIHNFYRSSSVAATSVAGKLEPSVTFSLRYTAAYAKLLEQHCLSPVSAGGQTYLVSAANAVAWSSLLRGCYETLIGDLGTAPKQAKCPASPCVGVRRALLVLQDLLECGIVEHLLVHPLVNSLNERYEEAVKQRFIPPLMKAVDGADLDSSTELEWDPDDLQATDEHPRRHILRHLRALTISLVAALRIVQDAFTASTVNLSVNFYKVIVAAEDPELTLDYVDVFQKRLFDCLKCSGRYEEKHLEAAFAAQKQSTIYAFSANVHAEAALMSLVAGDRLGQEDVSKVKLREVFPVQDSQVVPVGVSTRCCHCCSSFASLLRPRSFLLQGTHGVIVPWLAPTGVPLSALQALRRVLLLVLHRTLESSTAKLHSAQTSPAKSTVDLEMMPDSGDMIEKSGAR